MKINIEQALRVIPTCIKSKLVPMLIGSPGIGKSHIAHEIALENNLKVIDLRLAQCDPCDILGFPNIVGDKAGYIPMETFPIEGDELPEDHSGWLLFLDEFNAAPPAVQSASYKLVLDRMVGMHNLHPRVAIMCAGNKETDGAIVQEMSTALQSRLVHFELEVDTTTWLNWAMKNKVDHRITDYIKFKPGDLYTFSPDHTDKTYACPRTWEFVSRLLPDMSEKDPDMLPILSGTLSEGVAREFVVFMKIYASLPKISEIQLQPMAVDIPKEPSILFALTGALSHNMNIDTVEKIMKYVSRLPVEFQVVTLRETVRRNKEMLSHPVIQKWINDSSAKLF